MSTNKIYVSLNELNKSQYAKLWNFIFKNTDAFSFRFPNVNRSTSNTMKLKYNDNAQIDEVYCEYLDKNKRLIDECYKNLIDKTITNQYLDDKYSNLSLVFKCKTFEYIKNMILNKPNIFEWNEPDLPEDLSFYSKNELFMYSCSHEEICIFYLDRKNAEILNKIIEND